MVVGLMAHILERIDFLATFVDGN
uniref:Uncharacterized protein n=1 Tax=Arundo donax TaxID=35708 RepID=A0A0A9ACG8_ARUDO